MFYILVRSLVARALVLENKVSKIGVLSARTKTNTKRMQYIYIYIYINIYIYIERERESAICI